MGGYDLSGDIQALGRVGGGPAAGDFTGIDKSAYERLGLLRDGGFETTAFFNDATGRAHPRLSALPTTDVVTSYLRGTALGKPAACMVAKQIGYDGERGEDGTLVMTVEAQANAYGLEWGHNLTAGKAVSTAAEDLDGFDDGAGAATDFGLTCWLHVFAFTGTSVTVSIEDSDDDGAVDPYATVTGATFAAASAVGAQRIVTSATENVKEWLRVSTSGTYSALTFAVVVCRRLTATAF